MSRFHSLLSLGKHACRENARRLGEALHRLLHSPDAEAVHDVRVACRRLETALKIIEPLYLSKNLAPLRKKVKALLKLLSAVRDVEVLAERARSVGPQSPSPSRKKSPATHPAIAGALHLADLLDAQVELGRIEGAAAASHADYAQLPDQIEKALQALGLDRGKVRRFPRIRLQEFARDSLQEHLQEVQSMGIRKMSSGDELHTLRVSFKKLRYAAEFFTPGLPAKLIDGLVKTAQRYQQILGDLHDADVALKEYRRWHAVHARVKEFESKEPGRFQQTQSGISKLLNHARNDQIRLRALFFKLWSVRHQRELAEMVRSINPE